jgi:hypothetical protein
LELFDAAQTLLHRGQAMVGSAVEAMRCRVSQVPIIIPETDGRLNPIGFVAESTEGRGAELKEAHRRQGQLAPAGGKHAKKVTM